MQRKFLSVLALSVTLGLLSCSGNSNSVEGKIKQYFKDSVTPKLDDPSSLELVSVGKPDTITDHTLLQMELDFENKNYKDAQYQMQLSSGDSLVASLMKDVYLKHKHEADSINVNIEKIKKEMAGPDHIIGYESKVAFRAKNATGALMLNNITIGYYLANEADKRPEHFTVSMDK